MFIACETIVRTGSRKAVERTVYLIDGFGLRHSPVTSAGRGISCSQLCTFSYIMVLLFRISKTIANVGFLRTTELNNILYTIKRLVQSDIVSRCLNSD